MSANKPFSDTEVSEAKKWDLPFVDDPKASSKDQPTNALNKRSDWKYEPPEEEEGPLGGLLPDDLPPIDIGDYWDRFK